MKISVFMIVKNEEKNLPRALESAKWADEIVIVDSLSTDRTVGIATSFTKPDKVFMRAFTDYADQKNFAMSKATGDWLLSLDADEEITPELAHEIRAVMAAGVDHTAYRIRRRSQIFGRWFRFSGTQDDKPVRLFRRGTARFTGPVHEEVEVKGSTGELRNRMNHYTYPTTAGYIERFNRYTSMEAEYLHSLGRRPGFLDYWIKPWAMFFKLFIFRQGFRDGVEGFAFCCLSGFYVFSKHAKLAEKYKAEA